MKYLNDTGLTKLWEKIKSKFALQTDLEVIDERTINLNSSVTNLNDEVVLYSNSIGSLEDLTTTNQEDLVSAINEINAKSGTGSSGGITVLISEDPDNPIVLFNLEEGIYKLYGYVKYYPDYDGNATISSPTLATVHKSSTTTYIQLFEPYGNQITSYEITESNYEFSSINNNPNGSYISCIGKSGGLTTTTTAAAISSWDKVPIVVDSSHGSDFTLVDNQIVIGAGVNAIEVSAQAYYITNVTNGDVIRCGVCLNNSATAVRALTRAGGTYITHGCPPRIVPVSEGDVLDLRACNGARTGTVISSGADTFISVRKVA